MLLWEGEFDTFSEQATGASGYNWENPLKSFLMDNDMNSARWTVDFFTTITK